MSKDVRGWVESGLRSRLKTFLWVSLFAGLVACESEQQPVTEHEDKLSAAGFIAKPANTPERQEMLVKPPANKFMRREKGDVVHYVYADLLVCDCLYVGTQDAYNKYKANELAQNLADEQQITAQTYSDASWNWGDWGRGADIRLPTGHTAGSRKGRAVPAGHNAPCT